MATWERSSSPPPMEYWTAESFGHPGMLLVYIRYEKSTRRWYIVKYHDKFVSDEHEVLAGPFTTLRAAKAAWIMMFPG